MEKPEFRRQYGERFRAMVDRVWDDLQNEFGRQVLSWLVNNNLTLTYLEDHLALPGERKYHLIEKSGKNTLFEAEVIYKLAGLMGVSPVRLLLTYINSHGGYIATTFYGPYQEREYTAEEINAFGAVFETIWHMLIESPRFHKGDGQSQAEMALAFGELFEIFSVLPEHTQRNALMVMREMAYYAKFPQNAPKYPDKPTQARRRRYAPRELPERFDLEVRRQQDRERE